MGAALLHLFFFSPRRTALALSVTRAGTRALVIFSDRYFTIVVLGLNSLTLNLTHSVSVWCVSGAEVWKVVTARCLI